MKPVCSVLIAGPDRGWAPELAGELGSQDVEAILCQDPEEVVSGRQFDIAFLDFSLPGTPSLIGKSTYRDSLLRVFVVGVPASQAVAVAESGAIPIVREAVQPEVLAVIAKATVEVCRRRKRTLQSVEQFRLFSELPWFGMYVLDENLRFSYVSSHAAGLLGSSPEEMVGLSVKEVVHPEHREHVLKVLSDKLAGREYPPYAVRLLKKGGAPIWVEVYSRRADFIGRPAIVGLMREVESERHRSALQGTLFRLVRDLLAEEHPRTILQRVADAVTMACGFRRAVISLYDLSWPDPLDAPVHEVVTSGLAEKERAQLLSSRGILPEQRRTYFSEEFRLGPEAYYVPVGKNPHEIEGFGLPGTVEMEGWSPLDLLLIPLRARGRIIGHISLDDPVDPKAPTPETLEPVTHLAAIAALAVERAHERRLHDQHERHLAAAQGMGPGLTVATSKEDVLARAISFMGRELGYAFVGGGLVQELEKGLVRYWDKDQGELKTSRGGWPLADQGPIASALAEGKPKLVRNALKTKGPSSSRAAFGSFLAVPVKVESETVAVLLVAEKDPYRLSELDLKTVSTVALWCEVTLQFIQAQDRLAGLHNLALALSRAESRGQMLKQVMNVLKSRFSFDYCAFFKHTSQGLQLEALEVLEDIELEPYVKLGWRIPPGRGVVSWVAEHREPLLLADASSDPRYLPGNPDIRSELAVPVLIGDELLGVLNVESRRPSAFGIEELAVLQTVASQLAIGLDNLRSRERLQELAIRDPLTGLYNRRFLDEAVTKEVAAARRYRHPLTFLYLDVDGFREVNNRLGHLKGDEVLRRIGEYLVNNVREADYVARIGGDEFLIMLPETDGEVDVIVQRLKDGMARAFSDLDVPIGLSIGVATWEPEGEFDLDRLLVEADKRMYEDKRRRSH